MTGIYFTFHMSRHVVDAFEIGDGRSAEFHDNASHSLDQYHPLRRPHGGYGTSCKLKKNLSLKLGVYYRKR
ncbi:hypothetical protein D9M72_623850 [compost metagenome]